MQFAKVISHFWVNAYVYVLYVSCMYFCSHISIHMCMYCMYCMYVYVCCRYGMYWPRQTLKAYVCVLYVSCMYLIQSICACIACIVCMRMYAVCMVCIGPGKHRCQHNVPKRPPAGAAPRGSHSGHPWWRPTPGPVLAHPRAARVGGFKVHPLRSQ
jgi:hypothetical protein